MMIMCKRTRQRQRISDCCAAPQPKHYNAVFQSAPGGNHHRNSRTCPNGHSGNIPNRFVWLLLQWSHRIAPLLHLSTAPGFLHLAQSTWTYPSRPQKTRARSHRASAHTSSIPANSYISPSTNHRYLPLSRQGHLRLSVPVCLFFANPHFSLAYHIVT